MEICVYILKCADGSYYTGLTKKPVEAREAEHNAGFVEGYTHSRRPVKLVFVERYERVIEAIERERQIKGWSRKKKEALILYDYERLPKIARGRSRDKAE